MWQFSIEQSVCCPLLGNWNKNFCNLHNNKFLEPQFRFKTVAAFIVFYRFLKLRWFLKLSGQSTISLIHRLLVLSWLSHSEKRFHQLEIQATPTTSALLYCNHKCSNLASEGMKLDFRHQASLEYECLEEMLQDFLKKKKKVFTVWLKLH